MVTNLSQEKVVLIFRKELKTEAVFSSKTLVTPSILHGAITRKNTNQTSTAFKTLDLTLSATFFPHGVRPNFGPV
jgi:hypothetical protein